MSKHVVWEVYDHEGDFVTMFPDRNEAYEYALNNEPYPNSWEVHPFTVVDPEP